MFCDLSCVRDRGANRTEARSIKYHLIFVVASGITSSLYAGLAIRAKYVAPISIRAMSPGDYVIFAGIFAAIFGYNAYAIGRCADRIAERC